MLDIIAFKIYNSDRFKHYKYIRLETPLKIQLYPSAELAKILIDSAQKKEMSLNALILEVLENEFLDKEIRPLSELTKLVFDEVKLYVKQNPSEEFDLLTASETFRSIPMTDEGKPNPIRAQIGKSFANSIKNNRFGLPIQKVKLQNGKNKLSENNSLLYKLDY